MVGAIHPGGAEEPCLSQSWSGGIEVSLVQNGPLNTRPIQHNTPQTNVLEDICLGLETSCSVPCADGLLLTYLAMHNHMSFISSGSHTTKMSSIYGT